MNLQLCILGFVLLVSRVQCIMWYMEPNARKCLKEEIQGNVLVNGEYEVSEVPGQKINFLVSQAFFTASTFRLCELTFNMLYEIFIK